MPKSTIMVLAIATLGLLGKVTRAEVPFLIPVAGVLADTDDAPLEGSYTVVFTFYDSATGGVILGGETQEVDFDDGLFRAYLGSATSGGLNIAPFIDNEEVWLGVRVGVDSEMNRVRMAAVPWAFEAETCGQVTDLAAAGIQEEIGADACGAGQAMYGWDGSSAQCVALPDISVLVANSDIGTTVQAPIDQASFPCNYGIEQIGTEGEVVCANQDVVTQCGPEAGLGSNDNYLGSDGMCHKAVHSCTADQYLAGGVTAVCREAPHKCTANQYLDGDGTCQEASHKCTANQYLDGDGICQEAPHKCTANQYLDGEGTCVSLAVNGTAGTLAVFTDDTSVGNSIVTQTGTTGIGVAGSVSADSVSATGAVSAESLAVTNGLPIVFHWDTGTPQSNTDKVYLAYSGDDPGGRPSTKTMTTYHRSICFLTNIRLHDSADSGDAGECDIVVTTVGMVDYWQLVASRSTGVDVDCAARCISW